MATVQGIPRMNAEIVKKSPFRMETRSLPWTES